MSDDRGPWTSELFDVTRAASGGLLFGIPLLYTMEVWWTGNETTPQQALGVLGLTFVPVFLLNRTAGFRSTRDIRLRDALIDTIEALAIGLILVSCVLVLLRELDGDTSVRVGMGKVVYEALPFCIGIGVAKHFLRRGRDEGDDELPTPQGDLNATLADFGATLIGTVFVAFNIAPTDEIPMLTAAMGPVWLLAVVAASLLTSFAIVFVAGFGREDRRRAQVGILQEPLTETVACYLIALGSALAMLWVFQRIDGPWPDTLSQAVVLGFPASVGGAAGRLAI